MNESAWDDRELEGALRLDVLGGDRFANPRLSLNMNGVLFGGQYIANALAAAMLTSENRRPRHLQGLFLRPGLAGIPLELEVERVQDGRRLSVRRVGVRQSGRLIFIANAYLQGEEPEGPTAHHQLPRRTGESNPESLANLQELAERFRDRLDPEIHRRLLTKPSVLVKPLHPEAGIVVPSSEPRLAAWFKPAFAVADDPVLQYSALAFISDFWLCWPTRSAHIQSLMDPARRTYSLDHALWIHAPPQVDDWLLYEVESPVAGSGFGLGLGALYRRDGVLVASTAQQALLT